MRVPLSWLNEFVDLPEGTTLAEVHAALVKVGLEEEDTHGFELVGPIVVGQVLEFDAEPQSNGKTIRWCQVRVAPEGQLAADGGADVRGIVCGAGNFVVGDKVAVTLPGAVLPGNFVIAARKTYGHVSDGMIASARELGLGDEHDGILRLVTLGLDPEVGTDAIALLGLDDEAVEVNVTPDRGYAFSIRGIAREYAHSTGARFTDPAERVALVPALSGFSVRVTDDAPIRGAQGVRAFVTTLVRNVDGTRPTPPWMVTRLQLAGIRSISLLVDITNYVMLELGQPMHGYDFDALEGGITVRRAAEGEKFTTLDDKERTLSAEDLVITDDAGAIGLAGVMGGARTEMTAETRNVLVEAANFDPVSIARSARRHKLPSEASKRFERGVDPEVATAAAARVVELMVELAGGEAGELGSEIPHSYSAPQLFLPAGYTNALTGADYTADEERFALTEIGATLTDGDGGLIVTPPSWRPDITGKAELVEEVARIIGYDRIPSIVPTAPPGRGLTREQRLNRQVAETLAASGLVEVLAYPFVSAEANDQFGSATAGESAAAIKLANPLDGRAPFMRTSLIPGLIEVAQRNLSRGLTDLAIYELGRVFLPDAEAPLGMVELPAGAVLPSDAQFAALHGGIPAQPRHVGALLVGNTTDKQPGHDATAAGIAHALDVVRTVALAVGLPLASESADGFGLDIRQGSHHAFHPGRTAELWVVGAETSVQIGFAGELLPAVTEAHHLPRVVGAVELDLDAIVALSPVDVKVAPLHGFPAATQDLTVLVPRDLPAGDVRASVRSGAGELLESIRLVDDYRGAGVEDADKALTFALRFRASDRTLTAAEASEAKHAGLAAASAAFGARLRE